MPLGPMGRRDNSQPGQDGRHGTLVRFHQLPHPQQQKLFIMATLGEKLQWPQTRAGHLIGDNHDFEIAVPNQSVLWGNWAFRSHRQHRQRAMCAFTIHLPPPHEQHQPSRRDQAFITR